MSHTQSHRRQARRRASMYVTVLGSAMLMTTAGLAALTAVRVERRTAEQGNQLAEARLYARAAINMGRAWMRDDPDWRTNLGNGVWQNQLTFASGSLKLEASDPTDSDVTDSDYDPLVLLGTGAVGDAQYRLQVTLQPEVDPLEALKTCLHAGGSITINSSCTITVSGAPLSTNANLHNNASIIGDVEAATVSRTGTVSGTVTVPAPNKKMPRANLIDEYVALATTLAYNGDIDTMLIAPGVNDYGASKNSEGVYYIDTGSKDMKVRRSRIYGTLIIKVGSGTLTVQDDVLVQPYRSDYPSLIVIGNLDLQITSGTTQLSESAQEVNFNPTGVPYQGVTDTDKSDSYPNEIQGLVHVEGDVVLQNSALIRGVAIVEDDVTIAGTNTISYDASLYNNPPVGYTYVPYLYVESGTWKQIVDP